MSNMPEDLRARLAEINRTWGKDILGNGEKDAHLLKFTKDGKFLM